VYVNDRPFTFADMAKAVQRDAGLSGLGQCTPDPNDPLSCLPVQSAGSAAVSNAVGNAQGASEISSYYTTVGGVSISNTTLLLGGLAIAAVFFFGAMKK
jgi:hypothetical protein